MKTASLQKPAEKNTTPRIASRNEVTPDAIDRIVSVPEIKVQRRSACACGGSCPSCSSKGPGDQLLDGLLQTKLSVGSVNDAYEQEADRVADQVMAQKPIADNASRDSGAAAQASTAIGPSISPLKPPNPKHRSPPKPAPIRAPAAQPVAQRKASADNEESSAEENDDGETIQEKRRRDFDIPGASVHAQRQAKDDDVQLTMEDLSIQRHAQDDAHPVAQANGIEHRIRSARGGGQGLPQPVRGFMEQRFGADFSRVRIHQDGHSDQLNRQLHSYAFTTGHDIFFASGQFQANNRDSQRLLAHELTHVIQQTGARPLHAPVTQRVSEGEQHVQRYSESKDYVGNWAHTQIERLLEADSKNKKKGLITEAPIPGATRHGVKLNNVGFADLYTGKGRTVSGVQGFHSAADDKDHYDTPEARPLHYKNMPQGSATVGSKWAGIHTAAGSIRYGPTVSGSGATQTWNKSPDFPSSFAVGELKPLIPGEFSRSLDALGLGTGQVNNYRDGFQNFVKRAHADSKGKTGGPTRVSTSGGFLSDLNIPADINYAHFEKKHRSAGPRSKAIRKRDTHQRVWVYNLKSVQPGLYVYFLLPDPYEAANMPAKVEKILKELDPVLKELREKYPPKPLPGKLSVGKKAKPGAPRSLRRTGAVIRRQSISAITGMPVMLVQRDKIKELWKERRLQWEDMRHVWMTGKSKYTGASPYKSKFKAKYPVDKFMKEGGEHLGKRRKVDEKLKIPSRSDKEKDLYKKLKKIEFWSGLKGRLFGSLRFRFGRVFDKLHDMFTRLKKRFEKSHKNAGALNSKGGIKFGWMKTATKIIIKLAVKALKRLLTYGFSKFANCVNGMIKKAFSRLQEEATEKLQEELEPVQKKYEKIRTDLEAEFKKRADEIELFTTAVEKYKEWEPVLQGVEIGIRVGVQIVSCGTPPGLGCLWGLVAQLAIGTALDLLTETDFFENKIAAPAADKIIVSLFGDAFQNLVASTVEGLGLQDYAKGVGECQRVKISRNPLTGGYPGGFSSSNSAFTSGVDPNSAEIKKARAAWEKKYRAEFLKGLKQAIKGDKGAELTDQQLMDLLKDIQKSGKKPDELKPLIEKSKDPTSKKVDLNKLKGQVTPGTSPGGGQADKGNDKNDDSSGASVPVMDASKAGPPPSKALPPAGSYSIRVSANSGHVKGKQVGLVVWIYHQGKHVLTLTNVEATVVKRIFWPKGSDSKSATHMKVFYQLTKQVPCDPHLPGIILSGHKAIVGGKTLDRVITDKFKWPS